MIRGFDRAKTKKQKNKKTTAKTGRCLLYFLSRNLPSMPIWCQEGRGRMTAAYVSECSPALMAPARPLKHIRILLCKCLAERAMGWEKESKKSLKKETKRKEKFVRRILNHSRTSRPRCYRLLIIVPVSQTTQAGEDSLNPHRIAYSEVVLIDGGSLTFEMGNLGMGTGT